VSSLLIVKRGRWVLGFLLGCGVLAAAGWYIFADHQPYYQGRSLSTWLALYEKASLRFPRDDPEPAEALRQIGPRAVPCLMQWVRYERPAWQYKLLAALNKVPFPLHTYSTNLSRVVENGWKQREGRHVESLWAFGVLGPVARPAAAELGWLAMNRPGAVGDRAARALMEMGTNAEPATPLLIAALCSTNKWKSFRGIWLFERLNLPARIAVEPLLVALKDPNPNVRLHAIEALGELHAGANPAVPALVETLKDPNPDVRGVAEASLMKIPDYAVPKLTNILAGAKDFRETTWAIEALTAFGESARPALPALFSLAEQYPGFEPYVVAALQKIAPELARDYKAQMYTRVRPQNWAEPKADTLNPPGLNPPRPRVIRDP
jgi:hypothetical protein